MTMKTTATEGFDLIREPWVRVLLNTAESVELSVMDVFARAREIQRIAGESPQQDAALLRLLLVVFWRAHHRDPRLAAAGASGRAEWWVEQFTGSEDEASQRRVAEYLGDMSPRWDLRHPDQPFMQVAGLATASGKRDPITKLVPDAESPYFSVRAADGLDSVAAAEAARWLVHLQAWNYSGIKSGAVGDDRVKGGKGYPIGTGWSGRAGTVVLHGRNLAETLALNTPPSVVFGESMARDLPVWEQEVSTAAARGPQRATGPCDLLTWQSRRVRLFWEEGRVTGILVANGDRIESQNEMSDPMTAYRFSEPQSKKAGKDVWMPRAHSEVRTLWRGVEPLLKHHEDASATVRPPATVTGLRDLWDEHMDLLDEDVVVTAELIGAVYGTQDAVVTSTIHDEAPLRLSALATNDPAVSHTMISAAGATMNVAVALGQFSAMLRQAGGREYEFDAAATETALAMFDEPFKDWLARFTPTEDLVAQRDQWLRLVNDLVVNQARTLTAGVSPAAIVGREGEDGRLTSAATAWSLLRHRLQKELGATATTPRPGEHAR